MDKLMMKEYMEMKYGEAGMEKTIWERTKLLKEAEKQYDDVLKSVLKEQGVELGMETEDRLWNALTEWRYLEMKEAYMLGAEDRDRMLR